MPTENLRYSETNEILIPHWLTEKIQHTNYALSDFLHLSLQSHRHLEEIFLVSRTDMRTFKQMAGPMATLMNMPFLAMGPTLQEPRDWQTFIEGAPSSFEVDKLCASMPMLDNVTSRDIFHYNRTYIQLLKDVLYMSVIAAPILGISHDLAVYLRDLPIARLEAAIGAIKFPLFRWRFNDSNFWSEYASGWLTSESVAHYLMQTSTLRTSDLPYKDVWTDLRLERNDRELFARVMMKQGCRASTATALFNINPTKARTTYRELHGVSSPCGCNPSSLTWYVEQPTSRLQATVYIWLYRSALAAGANIPQALIAANDLMTKMFGGRLLITADRGNHLTRSMATDSRLTTAACRSCSTHYVLSNGEGKIELAKDFVCPGCSYLMTTRSQARRK
jgi:Flagellar transcriptional activator (FlhC)